jgi:hypothetical protein
VTGPASARTPDAWRAWTYVRAPGVLHHGRKHPVCHHDHLGHLGVHRHHRDGRRSHRHHRDDRRNRHPRPAHHRGDLERRYEPDAHLGDRQPHDRASCRGSGVERRDEDPRHRLEPDDHLVGGAFPGLERRGCCLDERATVPHGPRAARALRGHFGACPGSARRGYFRGEVLPGGARGAAHQRRPHVRQAGRGSVPWLQAPWQPAP